MVKRLDLGYGVYHLALDLWYVTSIRLSFYYEILTNTIASPCYLLLPDSHDQFNSVPETQH